MRGTLVFLSHSNSPIKSKQRVGYFGSEFERGEDTNKWNRNRGYPSGTGTEGILGGRTRRGK